MPIFCFGFNVCYAHARHLSRDHLPIDTAIVVCFARLRTHHRDESHQPPFSFTDPFRPFQKPAWPRRCCASNPVHSWPLAGPPAAKGYAVGRGFVVWPDANPACSASELPTTSYNIPIPSITTKPWFGRQKMPRSRREQWSQTK